MSGRGTAGGIAFQAWIAALAGGLMLSGRPLQRIAPQLPGTPARLLLESTEPVDDLVIETDVGTVFVQAKRTVSLSEGPKSELRSVAEQFVTQFRLGVEGGAGRRPLDPLRDRLLLAVEEAAPNTIGRDLREALARNATGAATGLPVTLRRPLGIWRDHLNAAWTAVAGAPASSAELDAVLCLTRVAVLAPAQEALVVEWLAPLAANGDGTPLFDALCRWGADSSQSGTGGDATVLRAYLAGRVPLATPPGFTQDLERLARHSQSTLARLSRFRRIRAPEDEVEITRAVVDAVVMAAPTQSFLVTGEPGAGKSAVLHAAAERLAGGHPTVMLSVEASVESQDGLRRDIGLDHPVIEVLAALPGPRPAYLIIDALDAARGGKADTVYRRLIEEVATLDGWRVIASVRTFDLRMGRDLRSFFAGPPPVDAFADAGFPSVRHLHVPLLTSAELDQVGAASATLGAALAAGGRKFEDLVRNPFNLGLLSDLLLGGENAAALSKVSSRGQLLEAYWLNRVEPIGVAGVIALSDVVTTMVGAKATSIRQAAIPIAAAATIDALAASGVVVRENTGRLTFRHHVLFDYAVARLVLSDPSEALRRFGRAEAAGLLLAPALGFWLDQLFRHEPHDAFWRLVAAVVPSPNIDPVVRVEVARLSVDLVDRADVLEALNHLLDAEASAPAAARPVATLVVHLVGALQARSAAGLALATNAWARFAAKVDPAARPLAFALRTLISLLVDQADEAATQDLGQAARRLMDVLLADETLAAPLSRSVIPFVAKTYASDPNASRLSLEPLLMPARFDRVGHVEVPALANGIASIAAADSEFAEAIYRRAFSKASFDHNQPTHMGGGWILSLSSNAAQDFAMAGYALGEAYPSILKTDPALGARLASAVLQSYSETEHSLSSAPAAGSIAANGRTYTIAQDYSVIWARKVQEEGQHEDWAKIAAAFLAWTKSSEAALTPALIDRMLEGHDRAVVWRIVLEAAKNQPKPLAVHLWPLATDPALLEAIDTEQAAIDAVAALYPCVSLESRADFERRLEDWPVSDRRDPEAARLQFAGKLFKAIGAANLVRPESQDRLAAAMSSGVSLDNEPLYATRTGRHIPEDIPEKRHAWMRSEGLDAPPNKAVLDLSDRLEEERKTLDPADPQAIQSCAETAQTLRAALDAAKTEGLAKDVDRQASHVLAAACSTLLAQTDLSSQTFDQTLETLEALALHPMPEVRDTTEADFAKHPQWGTPSPRVRAAQAIAEAFNRPGVWLRLSTVAERLLLADPHPAVRMQLASRLNGLWNEARPDMWRLLEAVATGEPNIGVLRYLTPVFSRLKDADPDSVEALFLPLLDRVNDDEQPQLHYTGLLTDLAIRSGRAASLAKMTVWLSAFDQHERWLSAALGQMRYRFADGFNDVDADKIASRERALSFLQTVIDAVVLDLQTWPPAGQEPTSRHIAALKLIDGAAADIFYGTGAAGKRSELAFKSDAAAAAFLDRAGPIIAQLAALGSPRAVHYVLQTLQPLIDIRPGLCFDLMTGALLRTGGVAQYQYESLGASLFVELTGRYLADHRALFENEVRRAALLDCIAVFVDAGWPEARRLFQSLPELFG